MATTSSSAFSTTVVRVRGALVLVALILAVAACSGASDSPGEPTNLPTSVVQQEPDGNDENEADENENENERNENERNENERNENERNENEPDENEPDENEPDENEPDENDNEADENE